MKTKKLDAKQLRRLVESVVNEASSSVDVSDEWAALAADSLGEVLDDGFPLAVEFANMIDGLASNRDTPYPARIEDVDAMAKAAADRMMGDYINGVRNLHDIVQNAIIKAMRRGF